MFSTADTIVAIATPPGRGALGVVRLSGPDAPGIAQRLTGRTVAFPARVATFARVQLGGTNGVGDEVVVTAFPAPRSSTGEDCVEISAHGSPVVLAALVGAAVDAGARLARAGEFSLRAFLHGKRDLVQSEAVADLIDAVTPLQARVAFDQLQGTLTTAITAIESELFDLSARLEASLDFPEEGYHFISGPEVAAALDGIVAGIDALLADSARGHLIRAGATVTLSGAPNVGKSSLFNALLKANRAIVTSVPGTTRDLVTERVEIAGLPLELVDTAGLRSSTDPIEAEGIRRAAGAVSVSDLVLLVVDRSRPLGKDDEQALLATEGRPRIAVVNKIDAPPAWVDIPDSLQGMEHIAVSVHTGEGLAALVAAVERQLAHSTRPEHPRVSNVRHVRLLARAKACVSRARQSLQGFGQSLPEEFLLADLHEARASLEQVTGQRTSDDLLRHIFQRFCVGK